WLFASFLATEKPFHIPVVVNIGFCGASSENAVGQLVMAGKVTDMDSGRDFYPDIRRDDSLPLVVLHCSSRRVTIGQDLAAQPGEPVWCDMESAGFMEAAGHFVTADRILILKIISDLLEPGRLDKNRLQQAIIDQMPALTQILKVAAERNVNDRAPVLPAELDDAIAHLIQKHRFTAAMGRQLQQAVRRSYVSGRDPLPVLRLAMNETIRQKTEGKRLFASILQKLTS
ncbi:MAG: nucleoside phosphorylase, partial [Bacillota bacterium]|nr:nucleoside phosphorylase [Bacillota bacterium]